MNEGGCASVVNATAFEGFMSKGTGFGPCRHRRLRHYYALDQQGVSHFALSHLHRAGGLSQSFLRSGELTSRLFITLCPCHKEVAKSLTRNLMFGKVAKTNAKSRRRSVCNHRSMPLKKPVCFKYNTGKCSDKNWKRKHVC